MALDPRYITDTSLEEYFVDKDTGLPLSGGVVTFWEDNARTTPKLVYELTGAPPNYSYDPLPNPMTLSSVGTPQNTNGDNVAIYYYPFDALGNLQLYYITVTNSFGEEQFTREAWPFNDANGVNPTPGGPVSVYNANQIKNPQFAAVDFIPPGPNVITISGAGTFSFDIAPEWKLNLTATAPTTVSVTRTSITGISAYPGNPPYTFTVTPGANITALSVSQLIDHDPDIWSPQAISSLNGWLNGSILLAPGSALMMLYAPSQGPSQLVLNANNMTGVYTQFNHTVQLAPATNTDSSDVGFVNIVLQLPVSMPTTFSNVQIVSLETNIANVAYYQTTVNMQQAQLSYFYFNLVLSKSSESYLVGWDFALNPAQFLGRTLGASASGANTSRYVWDQTIVFQSANNGPAISSGTNGCITITATNTTQFALIQYLEQDIAREILNNRLSVNVAAFTAKAGGLVGNISLWYTTDVSLPSCAANNSIVATIDATGRPATRNGTWAEIPRSNLGNAQFTVGASPTTTGFNNYGFSGWDLKGIPATNTATFFAIVVGFASLTAAESINISSISLIPGDVPSTPAPSNGNITLLKCQKYYEKSFDVGVIPQTNLGPGAVGSAGFALAANVADIVGGTYFFKNTKVTTPVMILYNPRAANNQMRNVTTNADCSSSVVVAGNIHLSAFIPQCVPDVGAVSGNSISFSWTADSRLGV